MKRVKRQHTGNIACKIAVILFYILLPALLPAQSTLRLQHLTAEDGLSQSSVYNVFQDSHGFMWFATGDGLNRYDGKEFLSYKSHFGDSILPDRNVNSLILEDRQHKLWISTDAGMANLDIRHKQYRSIVDRRNGYATLLGSDGATIWGLISTRGIYKVNTETNTAIYFPFNDPQTLNPEKKVIVHNGIVTANALYIADDAGLLLFDKKTHKDTRVITNQQINSVHALSNGLLALGTANGVYLYDTAKKTMELIPLKNDMSRQPAQWDNCVEDVKENILYLGAHNNSAVCKLDLATHRYEYILFQNSVLNCLYIDRTQNLWIGTEGNGAYKLDIKPPKFYCYKPEPLTSNSAGIMVKSIYRDDAGNIWVGTFDNGLMVYNPSSRSMKPYPLPIPTGNVLISSLLKDSSGQLVVAANDWIFWLNAATGKVEAQTQLPYVASECALKPIIYALTEWKKGHYFVGTNQRVYTIKKENGKLSVYAPRSFRSNGYTSKWIYGLYQDKDGSIYLGQRGGFGRIRMTGDTILETLDRGFDNTVVRHFYRSISTPVLWMATEQGLIAYNEKTKHCKVFDESSGLLNSNVYAILSENDSSLWVSTNQGISNVKVHYGNDVAITAVIANYTSHDGLQSNEFNTGAFYKAKDGLMFFGGIAGINWFDPAAIKSNPYKANPALAAILVNDTLFATDTAIYLQSLELPYNKNTISLSLRALEYTQPDQNMYAYMLEGLDKDWVYTTSDKVRYSNLHPGTYHFLLKVRNNESVWNETPLRLNIVIQPPYWQTWWFRTALLMLAAALIYGVIRYYIGQKIKAKTVELEKQHALNTERLRISKDVHDDLGSGLSKISLMAEIAQKRVTGHENPDNEIRNISTVSKELVDSMRDLIWVLNPENTTLDQLAARLREYCFDYLENMPISVCLHFPDYVPMIQITREAQRNIFLTMKEAINNCIKHSGATEIAIGMELDPKGIQLTIRDNGKGFNMAELNGRGNGLRNMRHRIEQISGSFEIISEAGSSTTIKIAISYKQLSDEITTLV